MTKSQEKHTITTPLARQLFLALMVFAAASSTFAQSDATEEEARNLALNRTFFEQVFNNGDLSILDDGFTEDFVEHEVFPGLASGKEGVRQFFEMFRAAFPDLKATAEMVIAKGDKVANYITITGTNTGSFMGMPATGKQINIKGMDIVRFEDGRAAEHWGVTDTMTMMQQLGVIPTEPAAAQPPN